MDVTTKLPEDKASGQLPKVPGLTTDYTHFSKEVAASPSYINSRQWRFLQLFLHSYGKL